MTLTDAPSVSSSPHLLFFFLSIFDAFRFLSPFRVRLTLSSSISIFSCPIAFLSCSFPFPVPYLFHFRVPVSFADFSYLLFFFYSLPFRCPSRSRLPLSLDRLSLPSATKPHSARKCLATDLREVRSFACHSRLPHAWLLQYAD